MKTLPTAIFPCRRFSQEGQPSGLLRQDREWLFLEFRCPAPALKRPSCCLMLFRLGQKTRYAVDDDFAFPSEKLGGKQPGSGSQLVEDYLRPAAIRACVIREKDGITDGPDGEVVKRFGFHTCRHSLATCLMDEQENPAAVQAIMRHSKMDMTLYYNLGPSSSM
jgi:integrase